MKLELGQRAKRALAAVSLACVSVGAASQCAFAAGGDLNLVCTGNRYTKGDPYPTADSVTFKLSDKKGVSIGFSDTAQPTKARIVANNYIQLKFAAKGLTGEYFYLSGDLFLIHASGRFTKLLCKPA